MAASGDSARFDLGLKDDQFEPTLVGSSDLIRLPPVFLELSVSESGGEFMLGHQSRSYEIPAEFQLRELVDADLTHDQEVVAWIKDWGVLELPPALARDATLPPLVGNLLSDVPTKNPITGHEAIAMTQISCRLLRLASETWVAHLDDDSVEGLGRVWRRLGFPPPDSWKVALGAVASIVNPGLAPFHPRLVVSERQEVGDSDFQSGGVAECAPYSAIAGLIYNGILARPVYKVCENKNCERRFIFARDDEPKEHHRSDARFCSRRCTKAQNERDRRAKKRKDRDG